MPRRITLHAATVLYDVILRRRATFGGAAWWHIVVRVGGRLLLHALQPKPPLAMQERGRNRLSVSRYGLPVEGGTNRAFGANRENVCALTVNDLRFRLYQYESEGHIRHSSQVSPNCRPCAAIESLTTHVAMRPSGLQVRHLVRCGAEPRRFVKL